MPPPEPEDRNRPERHHRRSARTRAQAARATRSTAAPAARAADRRASPAERSARRSNRPSSPARAPASCSRPPAPCSRGRSGRSGSSRTPRARSRTERRVHTSTAPQIASDHAWSRTASETRPSDRLPSMARAVELKRRPSGTRARLPRRTPSPMLGSCRIRLTNATRASRDPARRRTAWESMRRLCPPRSTQRDPQRARCRSTAAPRGASRACSWRLSGALGNERHGAPKRVHPLGRDIGPIRRDRAPRRARPRAEDDGERHAERQHEHYSAAPPDLGEAPEPEHRGGEEERDDAGDVVRARIGRRGKAREQRRRELRQCNGRQRRRQEEQSRERNRQHRDVEESPPCVTADRMATGSVNAVRTTPAGEPPTAS